jgi:hypothetical protein
MPSRPNTACWQPAPSSCALHTVFPDKLKTVDEAALTKGLEAASLNNVARAVREERAGIDIPAHVLYSASQQKMNGENGPPIYSTTSGGTSNMARRYTLSRLHERPASAASERPRSAQYSSPYLLKQFAPPSAPAAAKAPRTAGTEWRDPIDASANASSVEYHRTMTHGWREPVAQNVLDVEGELALQARLTLARENSFRAHLEADAADAGSPVAAPPPVGLEEEEECTPPAAEPRGRAATEVAAEKADPSHRHTRRSLELQGLADAASYYSSASAAQLAQLAPHGAKPPPTAARARALDQGRSDIFGHSLDERRGCWVVGPNVPPRTPAARTGVQ